MQLTAAAVTPPAEHAARRPAGAAIAAAADADARHIEWGINIDMADYAQALVDIIQTIGIIAAICFAAWEIRARVREQRFRNYLDSISGFVDLGKLMVERAELQALYNYSSVDWIKKYEDLTPDERVLVHYCDSIIALCETVWVASEEGWVPKDEWPYWKRWTDQLSRSPAFRWTVDWVREDYDEAFIAGLRPENAIKA